MSDRSPQPPATPPPQPLDYRPPEKPTTSKYPLAKVCPRCGNAGYRRIRPETTAAFTYDRICKACGVRYTPPTPLWAAVVFIVVGSLLALPFSISIIGAFLSMGSNPSPRLVGLICPMVITAIGVASIIHGIKALRTLRGRA